MAPKTPSSSLVLVGLLAVCAQLSAACPDGYHTFYCGTCPDTKCFNFFQEDITFRKDFDESNSFCSGEGTKYGATGRLLEFRSSCEFERVRSLVTALNPSVPYLTGLRYDMQGNIHDSVSSGDPGIDLSTILNGTVLQLTGATENAGMCVAIGRTSASTTDLIVVDCNVPAPWVCGLDTTGLSVPTIDEDARRYVGPDGSVTLICRYSGSLNHKQTTWLLNGENVLPDLGDGNDIDVTSTNITLTFTQFDRAVHSGPYQCRVEGLLGDLVSRIVDVLPARLPVIESVPMNLTVYENSLAFFDCFPYIDIVPHPTVQWSYNGVPLDVSNTSKYHVNPRTARLFISVVTQSDAGEYSCTLSNIEGSASSGAGTLTVMSAPSENPGNPDYLAEPGRDTGRIEVLEGTELIVECVANTSFPDVLYSWTHPSGGGDSRTATDVDYSAPSPFGNLVLPNVQMSMSGEYDVTVRLPGLGTMGQPLNAQSPRSVDVEVQAAPTITSVDASQVVILGSDVVLMCMYNGNPSPTVAWFKDGETVRASSKYSISNISDTVNTLTIHNVQPADLTSYQCHVSNRRGSNVEETFLCGRPGVPGAVSPTVEPFTKDSVRITWDPPAEPNDDIELLTYNVYFQIRNFGEPREFSIDDSEPDCTQAWNMRSVQVSGVTQQQFMVAYVVAVSANGMLGAVADEQSYGITYGNTTTVPPENVRAVQTNDQTVNVSWSAIPSDRQPCVDSDITEYEVQYYSVGGSVQVAINVQTVESTTLSADITYQRNNEMVLAARVRGVTQLRREPDSFGNGPWSEWVFSGQVPRCATGPIDVTSAVLPGVAVGCLSLFLLVTAASVVITFLCTRRCYKKSSSPSPNEITMYYETVLSDSVKMQPSPAYQSVEQMK